MTRANISEIAKHTHIRTPKLLLYGEKYKKLSGNAFKLYVALFDRFTLSIQNNWVDEDGNIFFNYSISSLEDILDLSRNTVRTARDSLKDVGLLEEVRTKEGPNRLYLNLPIPINDAEAKYIITDDELHKNPKELEVERNRKRSEKLKGNQNAAKTDGGQKLTPTDFKPSHQALDELEKTEGVKNSLVGGQNLTTNKNNLISNKDDKEIKDPYADQLSHLEKSFKSEIPPEENRKLIQQSIDYYNLRAQYGDAIVDSFIKWSSNSYEQFTLFVDKLIFAHKSVLKEQNIQFDLSDAYQHPEYLEMQENLGNVFYKVIIKYKEGNIINLNNYLFIAFKNYFESIARLIQDHKAGKVQVPLVNWLETNTESEVPEKST